VPDPVRLLRKGKVQHHRRPIQGSRQTLPPEPDPELVPSIRHGELYPEQLEQLTRFINNSRQHQQSHVNRKPDYSN
jgi:hypothetical protein